MYAMSQDNTSSSLVTSSFAEPPPSEDPWALSAAPKIQELCDAVNLETEEANGKITAYMAAQVCKHIHVRGREPPSLAA